MSDTRAHVTLVKRDSVHVVEFSDRKILEELSIDEIGRELGDIVDSVSKIRLVVSFRNVEHLSSAALGMLIKLNKKIESVNGSLRLSDISPQIFEVFKITGLNKLFKIHDTAQQATNSF